MAMVLFAPEFPPFTTILFSGFLPLFRASDQLLLILRSFFLPLLSEAYSFLAILPMLAITVLFPLVPGVMFFAALSVIMLITMLSSFFLYFIIIIPFNSPSTIHLPLGVGGTHTATLVLSF
jgi:hypothetical protein